MTFEEFNKASKNLKEFIAEQDKLDTVLKVISPTSTGVCEFGNKFIDDYINVVEIAIGDKSNWFSWFVFENDFGKREFIVKISNIEYPIRNEKDLFDKCLNN